MIPPPARVRVDLRRAAIGAAVARVALWQLVTRPPGGVARWQRTNHRGAPVSLLSGPALAVAAAGSASLPRTAAAVAGLGAALIGGYDDAVGARDGAKGFAGHVGAMRKGTLTAGGAKLVGISLVGAGSALALRPRRAADVVLNGAVIAGSANLVNLLDLRPGRALKVGLLAGAALSQPGIAGSCAALLPSDLGERTMLGDAGANALGAVLGAAVVSRAPSRRIRVAVLTGLVALTAASERISFSHVIDTSPPLRWLDQLGRRR